MSPLAERDYYMMRARIFYGFNYKRRTNFKTLNILVY